MYKRFNELSFVIGIFFLIVSLILIVNGLLTEAANSSITFWSAGCFLVFGIFMVLTKTKGD